jgi:hypothetical protein
VKAQGRTRVSANSPVSLSVGGGALLQLPDSGRCCSSRTQRVGGRARRSGFVSRRRKVIWGSLAIRASRVAQKAAARFGLGSMSRLWYQAPRRVTKL